MTKLQPLTETEIDRMRDVYASGPLETSPRHATTDAALTTKGWVTQYDEEVGTVIASRAAYGLSDGDTDAAARCVLYDERGSVRSFWRAAGAGAPAC